jgi:hypothetical protein
MNNVSHVVLVLTIPTDVNIFNYFIDAYDGSESFLRSLSDTNQYLQNTIKLTLYIKFELHWKIIFHLNNNTVPTTQDWRENRSHC